MTNTARELSKDEFYKLVEAGESQPFDHYTQDDEGRFRVKIYLGRSASGKPLYMGHMSSDLDRLKERKELTFSQKPEDLINNLMTQFLESNIASEHYFTAADGLFGQLDVKVHPDPDSPLHALMFCVFILKNGLAVIGNSMSTRNENFNTEIGRKSARASAISKLYEINRELAAGEL